MPINNSTEYGSLVGTETERHEVLKPHGVYFVTAEAAKLTGAIVTVEMPSSWRPAKHRSTEREYQEIVQRLIAISVECPTSYISNIQNIQQINSKKVLARAFTGIMIQPRITRSIHHPSPCSSNPFSQK